MKHRVPTRRARVWRLLRPVRDAVPLTVFGATTLLAAWAVLLFYGRGQADFVLRAGMYVTGAVVAASLLSVLLATGALFLRVRRLTTEPVEGHVETGQQREGLRLPRFAWWPLVVIDLSWRTPEGVDVKLAPERGADRERFTPTERGRPIAVVRAFTVRDIFGFAALTFSRRADATLRVAPARAQVDLSAALRHLAADGHAHPSGELVGDLVEMRRYAPGDPLRLVLWKAYARTRRLLVRMPERAIAPEPSTVAYFVAGPGDEPSASVARAFVEGGLLGPDFTFGADGTEALARTPEAAVEAIIDSVYQRARGGAGLTTFAAQVDPARLGSCVLFVPTTPGPWLTAVAAFAKRAPAPPLLLLTLDGGFAEKPPRLRHWLWRAPAEETDDLAGLRSVYDAVRALGAPVYVVHRGSGQVLDAAQIEALTER
ncbi:MAG: DUF58 domain-containing protein [Myxococcales bacterium]|nr:DUF58 domain-containing protein [Myxococcales bacterium]